MLIASKPHCHPRLPQPILKILSIYSDNFSRKQLSSNMLQIWFSYCLIHQNFNYFLKNQILSSKLSCIHLDQKQPFKVFYKICFHETHNIYRKTPLKLQTYILEKPPALVFSCQFYQKFQDKCFLEHLGWLFLLNSLSFAMSTSATKCYPGPLLFSK